MSAQGRPIFSIGAVARLLELAPATIRTWEARYGLVAPSRSAGGQRLYSREQVEHLQFVKRLVADGSKPAEAHRLLAERLARRERTPARPKPGLRISAAAADAVAVESLRRFLQQEGYSVEVALNGQLEDAVVELLPDDAQH